LRLGIGYQLVGAVMIALLSYSTDRNLQEIASKLGWLGVWIVVYPLVVPTGWVKAYVISLVAATMAPITYFAFAAVENRPTPSAQVVVSTFFPYYWCSGVALFPAVLMSRLGRTLSAARRDVRSLPNLLRTERLAVAGSLAAGVAHEVNNPLAAISSIVQTVHGKSEDPRSRELLGEALGQLERIGGSLQELMQFARPPARVVRPCNLNEIVERSLHFLGHDKRFRRISIETRLDPSLWTIQADPDQLQQVLTNLLLNARDALEGTDEPRIVVVTRRSRDGHGGEPGLELTVTDNGPGILEEEREQVFEPFFTTKPPGKGTGLGLAVCRELLREHEGTIALESGEGGGTTARVSLPFPSSSRSV
jgi:signal transduction histidine kinase